MSAEVPKTTVFSPDGLNRLNFAWVEASATKKFLEKQGSRGVILGNGGKADLEKIFQTSLLGLRPEIKVEVDKNALSPYEQSLINQETISILTIIDWDGVMGSPLHTVLKFAQNPASWKGGFGEMKKLGRINREEWRWFKKMAQASDRLVVWSSRFLVDEESPLSFFAKPFAAPISYLPFFDKSSLRRLTLIKRNKIEVWPQKPLLGRQASLEKIMEETNTKIESWNMIYYVGSSHFDRQTVRLFVKNNHDFAPRFAFFDTNHLFF